MLRGVEPWERMEREVLWGLGAAVTSFQTAHGTVAGVPDRDLAKAAGMAASVLWRLKTGRSKGVSLATLCRLSAALGTTVPELVGRSVRFGVDKKDKAG